MLASLLVNTIYEKSIKTKLEESNTKERKFGIHSPNTLMTREFRYGEDFKDGINEFLASSYACNFPSSAQIRG